MKMLVTTLDAVSSFTVGLHEREREEEEEEGDESMTVCVHLLT